MEIINVDEKIKRIFEMVLEREKSFDIKRFYDNLSATVACKMSIKANDHMELPAMEDLLERLRNTDNPFTCPHGRPTIVAYSKYELEKLFGIKTPNVKELFKPNEWEQILKEIHESYFKPGTHKRAEIINNDCNVQDEQAFRGATGRSGFKLKIGDKYGDYINQDLIEGAAHFNQMALVPGKIHFDYGVAENVGTAVDAYNWMYDHGYVKTSTSGTSASNVNTLYGGKYE